MVGYPSSILVSQVTYYRDAHCSHDSPMGVKSCLTRKYLSHCIVNSLLFLANYESHPQIRLKFLVEEGLIRKDLKFWEPRLR